MTKMPTIKKARLIQLLADLPDDADIFIYTKMQSVAQAVEAAKKSGTDDVFLCLAGNSVPEANGVSLVAYCGS